MKLATVYLLSILIVSTCSAMRAEADFDPQARADGVSPFVDEQTVLVAFVDLSQVDIAALTNEAARFLGVSREEMTGSRRNREHAEKFVEQLKSAGVARLYVAATIEEMVGEKLSVIVPLREGVDPLHVARLMYSGDPAGPANRSEASERGISWAGPFETCQQVGNVVFCGSKSTLERLDDRKPMKRPELVDGFRAAGDTIAQVVLMPPEDARRVLADVLPRLPMGLGGVSGKELADGLQWAALGIEKPPTLSAKLTIQSANEEAALSTQRFIASIGVLLTQLPGVRQEVPAIDDLLELFTPKLVGSRLVVELSQQNDGVASLQKILGRQLEEARGKAIPMRGINQLRQLALAMANFESANGGFAPSASYDNQGKQLLSWRVFMLPFLEQKELYDQFRLDEPWDSDHNKKLIAKMPAVFASGRSELREQGKTRFVVPVGKGSMFWGKEGTSIRDVKDGTSNTILLVEVAPEHAVTWTKPDDWLVDFSDPLKGLLGDRDGFLAARVDASARFISKGIEAETLRRMLTIADGKPIEGR